MRSENGGSMFLENIRSHLPGLHGVTLHKNNNLLFLAYFVTLFQLQMPSKVTQVMTLLARIQKAPGSYLDHDTGYPD
jgi:hypothetical protein